MMALDAPLDTAAVRAAHRAFVELLKSEAEDQHAYVAEWPDGRVSLELEGADFRSMIQAAIKTYLAATAGIPTLARDEVPLLDR